MTGREYLEKIRVNLESGQRQHRMGENVLAAFGYLRRTTRVIDEINSALDDLGIITYPPIDSEMPFKYPRIRFSLRDDETDSLESAYEEAETTPDIMEALLQDIDDMEDINLPNQAFSVSDLPSADKNVEWIFPNATMQAAYTKMVINNYSQLVVADCTTPLRQDIKGVISFQSMTNAMMNGDPRTVGDCIDKTVPIVEKDTDLRSVVDHLSRHDVVLVVGIERRLQGIVTAWDLAAEFAQLVDPFKRIGEIEERLRILIERRLGQTLVSQYLVDNVASREERAADPDLLTMGDIQRVLENPGNWDLLQLPFERGVFIDALDKARRYRNQLMHFRGPLSENEVKLLQQFCDAVRKIRL